MRFFSQNLTISRQRIAEISSDR